MMMIIGGHMSAALSRAGKKGIVSSAMFDNWWQGGFRTTAYRHNIMGILTEAASALIASPIFQRKSQLRGSRRGMPSYAIATNFPDPWPGGWWRLRDIVEYEKVACMSLFTLAARYHDLIKSNTIRQARDAIERGSNEPPFAWLVPPDQSDPSTAAQMLSILHATGIEIHRAGEEFTADDVQYPSGTYIMYCAQPYRAHLNDMMERQVYPDRSSYPGGPPETPYDSAGWTLPLQMGVRSVSVNQPFECRARKLEAITRPQGKVMDGSEKTQGYLIGAGANDNYRLVNRLFKTGIELRMIASQSVFVRSDAVRRYFDNAPSAGSGQALTGTLQTQIPLGSLFIPDNDYTQIPELLDGISTELIAVPQEDSDLKNSSTDLSPPRLGLYQPWTASKSEGWTRLVLDNFEFAYFSVHNAEIRAGNLAQRYDCLILPSISSSSIIKGRSVDTTEPQYVGGIGKEGIVTLQDFVRDGGTLICIDRSCNLPIGQFNIPVRNILSGKSSKEFFCPGSILRIRIDDKHPVGYGCPEWISGYFARSQAFDLIEDPNKNDKNSRSPDLRYPARVVARYSDTVLLESGWIRGAELIADKPAIVEVRYGEGKIILLGFAVQHRGQPHGTFKLLFNSILASSMASGSQ
jgi:hypothetical protein